jgi:hypothetical protein
MFFSLGNTIANLSGVVAPIVAGAVLGDSGGEGTTKQAGHDAWNKLFALNAVIYGAAMVATVLFMKGKPLQELN